MSHSVLVSVFCPDRTGLVAAITGTLFDLGANLGDTTFAVLGGGAEFTGVIELPDGVTGDNLSRELNKLPELADAKIGVQPFTLDTVQGPGGQISHRVILSGGDQPGLVARLCEAFVEFKTNIVRLDSERTADGTYIIRFHLSIPPEHADACLATVANTAEGLQMACKVEAADSGKGFSLKAALNRR